jgi:hypothetical protein
VKFSELLGEPEPEPELPAKESEPISVFAPVPTSPPPGSTAEPPPPAPPPSTPPPLPRYPATNDPSSAPTVPVPAQAPPIPAPGLSGLAELNVRQPVAEAPTEQSPLADQLIGLTAVEDDLLPSGRRGRK